MAALKSLAKDTAVYGLSSIIGRFLNYLLVPIYTTKLAAASGGYGVITEMYSYTALLLVILTFGMETTFFRFINKADERPRRVYSTALLLVSALSLVFLAAVLGFLPAVSSALGYAAHPEYLAIMATIVAMDAIQAIPFAYLRYRRHALKFAALKMLFILLSIALNIVAFVVMDCRDVLYAFAINLACTAVVMVCFIPELRLARLHIDLPLARRMLRYAWPLLLLGIAGILNQTVDKMIFPHIVGGEEGRVQLGIYGASVKIAMIMAMITQAFRYAYEPLVFAGAKGKDSATLYAKGMKYFVIFTLLAFLAVIAYLDILKYIIGADYREGLKVVPIVMAAEILMGVYFNLSFWYKLCDRTIRGAWCSAAGCVVLIAFNVVFIPSMGYMACAWAGVAGYGTATLVSYLSGQHFYPIRYPWGSIAVYVVLAAFFYAVMTLVPAAWPTWCRLGINTLCLLAFAGHIVYHDLPLASLPVVGKYFRKR